MSDINDLIGDIINKDYKNADEKFSELMSSRINDALNQTKVSIASNMFKELETETDESADDVELEDSELDLENEND